MDTDRRQEAADLVRSVRDFGVHDRDGAGSVKRSRAGFHFAFAVPYLYREQRRVGHRSGCRAEPIHCVARLDSELRRISGGALAPTVTGLIVQQTGSFSQALILSAVLSVVAAAAYLWLVRGPIPSGAVESAIEVRQVGQAEPPAEPPVLPGAGRGV